MQSTAWFLLKCEQEDFFFFFLTLQRHQCEINLEQRWKQLSGETDLGSLLHKNLERTFSPLVGCFSLAPGGVLLARSWWGASRSATPAARSRLVPAELQLVWCKAPSNVSSSSTQAEIYNGGGENCEVGQELMMMMIMMIQICCRDNLGSTSL